MLWVPAGSHVGLAVRDVNRNHLYIVTPAPEPGLGFLAW